jgi:PHD/YefM family antitoxin component YafN of YafNO toxin-antitoxin module
MGIPKIKKSSDLRQTLPETLKSVNNGNLHVITHNSGNVVLISEDNYSELNDKLEYYQEIIAAREQYKKGATFSHDEVKSMIKSKFGYTHENQMVSKGLPKSRKNT